jgi:diamine N-acetyltransferase
MSTDVRFRRATAADLSWILEIEADARSCGFLTGSTREEHEDSFTNSGNEYWIAEQDGVRVAELILRSVDSRHQTVEMQRIVVTRPGQGIGETAMRWALDRCFREHGAHRVWLHTFDSNQRAQRLYTRLGFTVEGTLREAVRWTDGTRRSLMLFSILRSEYERI